MNRHESEREIAKILARLESDSGSVVRSISVEDIEVTNIESDGIEFERRVIIDLERLPGTHWGQAK